MPANPSRCDHEQPDAVDAGLELQRCRLAVHDWSPTQCRSRSSKGPPHVTDAAFADHQASDRPTRRALLGVGLVGAALAIARSDTVSAGPSGLSESDVSLAEFAIANELAARDLYDQAIGAGASEAIWSVLREQHESYAQRIAGIVGVPANTRNEALYASLSDGFNTATPATAAFELESVTAATSIDLLSSVADPAPADALASIAAMESRHATVLAAMSGRGNDFDALFESSATPITNGAAR
jgi:hypothetical protein